MTFDSRLNDLERKPGADDGTAPAPVVKHDPASVPEDPAKRDAWLKSHRPEGAGAVFFAPDNGRNG
jgi:hypothetical protein